MLTNLVDLQLFFSYISEEAFSTQPVNKMAGSNEPAANIVSFSFNQLSKI